MDVIGRDKRDARLFVPQLTAFAISGDFSIFSPTSPARTSVDEFWQKDVTIVLIKKTNKKEV